MITGFNTDIEFDGVTYHVQTEDKGLSRPIILSLVYDGGTILASKRLPYDDLLKGEFDETLLAERLQKQHRLICAAVRAGRIEDLKRMTSGEPVRRKFQAVSASAAAPAEIVQRNAIPAVNESPIPKPQLDTIPVIDDELGIPSMVEGISIIEEIVIPDEAVEIVSEMVGKEWPANNRLTMELLGSDRFVSSQRCTIDILLCRGSAMKVVAGAQIMAKILGSSFRPLIFHAVTDANGVASIILNIPHFTTGRAAILVRAVSDGEQVELRRVISHN